MPRPLGMLDAVRHMLPVWEERLEPAPAAAFDQAGQAIARQLSGAV
jgi:hypothetical protein